MEENILTVEQLIARLNSVKDKTLPVYAWDSAIQMPIPITDTDFGVSDRVDLQISHTAVDRKHIENLVSWLMRLPEGDMYDLGESSFFLDGPPLSGTFGPTVVGFGKKDGLAVVVINKDSFFPVSKMDKTDIEFMFLQTTLSKYVEAGDFKIVPITECIGADNSHVNVDDDKNNED